MMEEKIELIRVCLEIIIKFKKRILEKSDIIKIYDEPIENTEKLLEDTEKEYQELVKLKRIDGYLLRNNFVEELRKNL